MRKTAKNLLRAAVIFTVASCGGIPYQDDIGYLVAAQANSHEVPVRVNGSLCKDLKNKPGACTIQITSQEDLVVRIDPLPYSYQFIPNCTPGVDAPPGASVAANKVFTYTIKPEMTAQFRTFTCIGEIHPDDREMPISAKWRVSAIIVDAAYEKREGIYIQNQDNKNYVVLGQFARTAWVRDARGWHLHNKETAVEVQGDLNNVRAYSESYAMRYNDYNLTPKNEEKSVP